MGSRSGSPSRRRTGRTPPTACRGSRRWPEPATIRGAARLIGAAETLLESSGVPLYAQVDHELSRRVADAARERLGEQAWNAARDEGRAMAFDEAVAYALDEEDGSPASP